MGEGGEWGVGGAWLEVAMDTAAWSAFSPQTSLSLLFYAFIFRNNKASFSITEFITYETVVEAKAEYQWLTGLSFKYVYLFHNIVLFTFLNTYIAVVLIIR